MADNPVIDNLSARQLCLMYGLERFQPLPPIAVDPANQNMLNIGVQPVGLVRGFLIKVSGTIRNTHATQSLTRTNFGPANFLRDIGFRDTNGLTRHATQGWHLNMINNAKQPIMFGGAYASNLPMAYGSNYPVISAPATIAPLTDATVQMYYLHPLSYSKVDLRGAMWASTLNASADMTLQINPNPVVAAPNDAGLALYTGVAGSTGQWKPGTTVSVSVWQDYLDQIPTDKYGVPMLPVGDMGLVYQLNTTSLSGMVAGQDYGIPFANFRDFFSSSVVYSNGGVYNAGTDINYFALQTANSSNIWKYGPSEAALLARSTFSADPPPGVYYFDHRVKPISVQNYGNTQITVNPITVANGASISAGFEYMAAANQVVFAGSIPSG